MTGNQPKPSHDCHRKQTFSWRIRSCPSCFQPWLASAQTTSPPGEVWSFTLRTTASCRPHCQGLAAGSHCLSLRLPLPCVHCLTRQPWWTPGMSLGRTWGGGLVGLPVTDQLGLTVSSQEGQEEHGTTTSAAGGDFCHNPCPHQNQHSSMGESPGV